MPRLSRALAGLPECFEPVQSGNQVVQPPPDRGEAGVADPVALDLEIGNVARVIAGGDLAGAWQLGAVIGVLLTSGGGR